MHHATLERTRHATHRSVQRTIPECVLARIERGDATDVPGRHPHHPRVTLRIVRTADGYWVAPHADGSVLTVYEVAAERLESWAWRHLHHPEQQLGRLRRLPVHHTPEQAVTADLYRMWVVEA